MGGLVSANNSMYKGKVLIAHPKLDGSIFSKSVIYIYQDGVIGTNGIILNKKSDWDLAYMFDYKNYNYYSDDFVYLGGPVSTTAITLLHTDEFYSSNTLSICDGLSVSSDNFMFEKIAEGNEPQNWRMFIGVCGWGDGQLKKEIENDKCWLLCEPDNRLVFNYTGEEQWEKAVEKYSQTMVDTFFA